jgi:hypothetical protein
MPKRSGLAAGGTATKAEDAKIAAGDAHPHKSAGAPAQGLNDAEPRWAVRWWIFAGAKRNWIGTKLLPPGASVPRPAQPPAHSAEFEHREDAEGRRRELVEKYGADGVVVMVEAEHPGAPDDEGGR